MDPSRLCRLCLITSDDVLNIWKTNYLDSSIASILSKHFWFEIHRNDGLTEWLCRTCWLQTKLFHEFYTKVERHHKSLLDYVNQKDSELPDVVGGTDPIVVVKVENVALECHLDVNIKSEKETNEPEKINAEEGKTLHSDCGDNKDDNEPLEFLASETDQPPISRKCKQLSVKNDLRTSGSADNAQTLRLTSHQSARISRIFSMKCDMCTDQHVPFTTLLQVSRHYPDFHKTQGYLKCCGRKFWPFKSIWDHVLYHENVEQKNDSKVLHPSSDKRAKIDDDSKSIQWISDQIQWSSEQKAKISQHFSLKCDICTNKVVQFQTLPEVSEHYRDYHNTNGYLMCCGRKFWPLQSMLNHVRYHQNEEQWVHVRELFTMKCDICPVDDAVRFESIYDARQHYREEHNTNGYLVCCGRKMDMRNRIWDHVRGHTNPNTFFCDICGKGVRTKQAIKSHMDSHIRRHKCDQCSKRFAAEHKLKYHVQVKHSKTGKNVPCDKCNKTFRTKLQLYSHDRYVHNALDNQVCEICAQRFKSKNALEQHITSKHSMDPPPKVQCNICGAWLNNKYGLTYHVKYQHAEGPVKPLKCTICGKLKKNELTLKEHIRSVHAERQHQCTMCDKAFKTKLSLKEHIACHTGQNLYNCPYCEKTFKSNANMYSHRKKAHHAELIRHSAK